MEDDKRPLFQEEDTSFSPTSSIISANNANSYSTLSHDDDIERKETKTSDLHEDNGVADTSFQNNQYGKRDDTKTHFSFDEDEIFEQQQTCKEKEESKKWKTLWKKLLYYPPNIPKEVQLTRIENIAIPASYLVVGLLQGLSGPFINVYPLDLNATEAQQTTISSLRGLPAAFKLVFGFISDTMPIYEYRRKSYMLIGWIMTSLSMNLLLLHCDLNLHDDDKNEEEKQPPSIPFFSLCVFLFGMGFWFADVMADAVVAEKAKLEPESSRGQLQSTCYASRFFGLMVASPLSTAMYSSCGPEVIVQIMAFLPLCMLPLVYYLNEMRVVKGYACGSDGVTTSDTDDDAVIKINNTREQCHEIWTTVCSRAVWQPMIFVYLYNVLQVGNGAWREYLKSVLHFTPNQLNALLVMAYILLYLGVMTYKYYLITWSWRYVYVIVLLINGFFSALQLLLIKGFTFGLSPFVFAMGDDAIGDFLEGIQFLPITIMMVNLCPEGSEGASYAMFTTVSNSAINLSVAISTLMLGIWDVGKETLISGDLSGMVKLTIATSIMQTSAILFIKMMPNRQDDLDRLHKAPYSGSKFGGSIFLSITLLSILYTIVVGVLNIVMPGWAGES